MKHKNKYLANNLLLLVLISFLAIFADDIVSDAANSGFQMLEEPVDPISVGMGYAGVATEGFGISYYNPAKPALFKTPAFRIEYGQYPAVDWKRANVGVALPIKNAFVAFDFRNESIEDIYAVDAFGGIPSEQSSSYRLTELSLAGGFTVKEFFSVGISVSGIQDHIFDEYAYALAFGMGAIYTPVLGKLNIGLSIVNLGFTTPMLDSGSVKDNNSLGKGERLPVNSRLGISWSDSIKTVAYRAVFDIVYRNTRDRDKSFTSGISSRFTFPVGIEVRPVEPLSIRMGKRINFSRELLNLGIGIKSSQLTVDVSFVIPKLIDDTELKWSTAVTYNIKRKKDIIADTATVKLDIKNKSAD